ncbi:hypothetical protein N9414_05015 [Nodularia spumigena CCY9414]|jgi:hypothetical protein|nr:hypothetical protein N9414_05015 [Nodularia spumigena CCY9414]
MNLSCFKLMTLKFYNNLQYLSDLLEKVLLRTEEWGQEAGEHRSTGAGGTRGREHRSRGDKRVTSQ